MATTQRAISVLWGRVIRPSVEFRSVTWANVLTLDDLLFDPNNPSTLERLTPSRSRCLSLVAASTRRL